MRTLTVTVDEEPTTAIDGAPAWTGKLEEEGRGAIEAQSIGGVGSTVALLARVWAAREDRRAGSIE